MKENVDNLENLERKRKRLHNIGRFSTVWNIFFASLQLKKTFGGNTLKYARNKQNRVSVHFDLKHYFLKFLSIINSYL